MLKAVLDHFFRQLSIPVEKEKEIRRILYCVSKDERWSKESNLFLDPHEQVEIPTPLSHYQHLLLAK